MLLPISQPEVSPVAANQLSKERRGGAREERPQVKQPTVSWCSPPFFGFSDRFWSRGLFKKPDGEEAGGMKRGRREGWCTENRESRGIDRFCDYPCVYCVILSCARRTQSNAKCNIHQTFQCDAYVQPKKQEAGPKDQRKHSGLGWVSDGNYLHLRNTSLASGS